MNDYNNIMGKSIWMTSSFTFTRSRLKKRRTGTSNFSKGFLTLQFPIHFLFIDKWWEEI